MSTDRNEIEGRARDCINAYTEAVGKGGQQPSIKGIQTVKEWCETCEGLGEGFGVEQGPNGPIERNDVKCPDCSGHGYIECPKRPPVINISCEIREDGMIGTTSLNVIRVEPEDDGSWTAVTDYWPGTELPKVQWSRELPTIQGWYWVRPMTSYLGTPTLKFLSRGHGYILMMEG